MNYVCIRVIKNRQIGSKVRETQFEWSAVKLSSFNKKMLNEKVIQILKATEFDDKYTQVTAHLYWLSIGKCSWTGSTIRWSRKQIRCKTKMHFIALDFEVWLALICKS